MNYQKIFKTFLISIVLCLLSIPYLLWAQDQKTLTYENKALGLKIIRPENWHVDVIREDAPALLVIFSQFHPSTKNIYLR